MDQVKSMGVGQAESRLPDDFAGVFDGDAMQAFDELIGIESVYVLHHEEVDLAGQARVESLNDVRGIESADGTHLSAEPLDSARVVKEVRSKDFDGDGLVKMDVEGFVDRTHPAPSEDSPDLILAESTADEWVVRPTSPWISGKSARGLGFGRGGIVVVLTSCHWPTY
jgi:hypothetical protein